MEYYEINEIIMSRMRELGKHMPEDITYKARIEELLYISHKCWDHMKGRNIMEKRLDIYKHPDGTFTIMDTKTKEEITDLTEEDVDAFQRVCYHEIASSDAERSEL